MQVTKIGSLSTVHVKCSRFGSPLNDILQDSKGSGARFVDRETDVTPGILFYYAIAPPN